MSPITNCYGKQLNLFFSDKGPMRQKITLINDEIIDNSKEISEISTTFSQV